MRFVGKEYSTPLLQFEYKLTVNKSRERLKEGSLQKKKKHF